MTGISLDDAKEAKAQARQGNLRDNDAGITDDHAPDWESETVIDDLKGHAEALVTFDYVSRISINDYGNDDSLLELEQNLQGAGRYGYTAEITVANPTIADGQLWKQDGEYPEYKVIGDPESEDNDHDIRENVLKDDDGNVTGAETEGIFVSSTSKWDGQPVEGGFNTVDADHATFEISASRAMDVLGVLDTAGMWFRGPEGNLQEGLFEAPPSFGTDEYDSDTHGHPRLVGYPELRADMVGQQGAISFTYGEEGSNGRRPKEVDLYKVADGELQEALVPLTPDDDAYNLPEYPRSNNSYWDEHGDGSTGSSAIGADAEPETDDGVAEAQAMMEDSDDSDDGATQRRHNDGHATPGRRSDDADTFFDELTDDGQEFVEDAITAIDELDYESVTEFDDYSERVATAEAEADGGLGADPDTLADIIDSRADT